MPFENLFLLFLMPRILATRLVTAHQRGGRPLTNAKLTVNEHLMRSPNRLRHRPPLWSPRPGFR